MAKSESGIREEICEIGRRLWTRGFVASNDGNISVRLGDEILATPTGVSKGFMTPEMLCRINLDGELIEGDRTPSSEMAMHLAIYRARPEINAVVHAHPPISTGFAVARKPLRSCALPEAMVCLGSVAFVPYATPGAGAIPKVIAPFVADHDAFLLCSHGTVTIGQELFEAYYRMETLEHFAHISWVAQSLGGEHLLTAEQVRKLQKIRTEMGLRAECDSCEACDARQEDH